MSRSMSSPKSSQKYSRIGGSPDPSTSIITLTTLAKSLSPKSANARKLNFKPSEIHNLNHVASKSHTDTSSPEPSPSSSSPHTAPNLNRDVYVNYAGIHNENTANTTLTVAVTAAGTANGADGTPSGFHSDSDLSEEDDTPESTARLQPPRHGSIYNFEHNETILKQDLVEKMIERLKIGITFLLHDLSPLWNELDEIKEEDFDDDLEKLDRCHLQSIYPKGNVGTLSTRG